jgi:hypothetical protein
VSVSPEDRLRSQVYQLAEFSLPGTATAKQIAQLEGLLQTHPSARRHYLEFIQDSYSLRMWALAQAEELEDEWDTQLPEEVNPQRTGRSGPHRAVSSSKRFPALSRGQRKWVQRTLVVAASLAAVFLLAIRMFPALGPDGIPLEDRPVVASIVDTKDGVWSEETKLISGASLHESQQLQLATGVARIRFGDGATVTLEGPVSLELLSAGSARLKSGILTSYVPPEAIGFQVRTEALDVVDLGTSFGVAVTDLGETSVSVFSGRVEVTVPESADETARIVNQGESVRANTKQATIVSIDSSADQFSETQKAAMGVESTAGAARFLAERAAGGILPEDNEQILVALEGRGVMLRRDLVTNFVPKPDGSGLANGNTAPIAAGTRVDCFLVQFRPEPNAIPKQGSSAAGRITFDRPILGLISRNQTLTKTDKLFADGETGIKQNLRGGESGENANERERDTLIMSDDRRTIEVTAKLRRHMDQVRVLVRATDDEPDSTTQTNDR